MYTLQLRAPSPVAPGRPRGTGVVDLQETARCRPRRRHRRSRQRRICARPQDSRVSPRNGTRTRLIWRSHQPPPHQLPPMPPGYGRLGPCPHPPRRSIGSASETASGMARQTLPLKRRVPELAHTNCRRGDPRGAWRSVIGQHGRVVGRGGACEQLTQTGCKREKRKSFAPAASQAARRAISAGTRPPNRTANRPTETRASSRSRETTASVASPNASAGSGGTAHTPDWQT